MKLSNTMRLAAIGIFAIFAAAAGAYAQVPPAVSTGKTPVIIVPGLTGSDLYNRRTGEEVWFKSRRSKDDDIRLPISANLARNRDNLVPRDIIRSVKIIKFLPETEIYERLVSALETRGGYKEGLWTSPPKNGHQDTFYVFSYDWRRDNVENARKLITDIEALKRRLGKPALKFNVVAHSMGGIISRYAAMYGNADVPAANPTPTWNGARHFAKIMLVGTPNEGSILSLAALLNGYSYVGGGINLPFIQNIDRFDVFTMPSSFQLLPHAGTLSVFDENLKPLSIDLFDPKNWEKYGWAIWQDGDFKKKMSAVEQRNARAYFSAALLRAKRFQAALDANSEANIPVSFYLVGAECKETPNAMLLLHDAKENRWSVKFKPDGFTRADGTKVSGDELKTLMVSMGDSVVTKRSLAAETLSANGNKSVLPIVSELYRCEEHSRLITNPEIQDKLLQLLSPATVAAR